jgi:hypothetical protein
MLAALALAADLRTTLHLGDRTDVRWRFYDCGGPCVGLDLTTTPAARLDVASRRTTLSVSYAPMFTWREPLRTAPDGDLYGVRFTGPNRNVEQLQAGSLTLFHATRRLALGLFQDASFGDMNYTYLTPTSQTPGFVPPTPHPLLPPGQTQTLLYGATRSAASFGWTTSEHTRTSAFAQYSASGGLDARSKLIVPLVSAARGELAFDARVAKRWWLETRGGPGASNSTPRPCNPETGGPQLPADQLPPGTQFPYPTCAPVVVTGELREVVRWQASRKVTASLSGGVVVTAVKLKPKLTPDTPRPEEDYRVRPNPDVRLDVSWALAATGLQARSIVELRARLSPVIDFRFALPDPRAEIGAAWTRTRGRWESRAELVYVQSIPGVSSVDSTYVGLSAEAFRAIDKRFDVGLGARGAWQWDPTFGFFFTNGFFATFRWRETPIRL